MSSLSHHTRSLLAYLVLVVPPFCVLLTVLHFGKAIEPPRSIGGTWTLEFVGHEHEQAPCALVVTTLETQQSGPKAQAALRGEASSYSLSITLDGAHLSGSTSRNVTDACQRVELVAHVESRDELTGTLRRPGCEGCTEVSFRATRKRSERAKSHH